MGAIESRNPCVTFHHFLVFKSKFVYPFVIPQGKVSLHVRCRRTLTQYACMLFTLYLVAFFRRLIDMTISLEGLFLYSLLDICVTTQADGEVRRGEAPTGVSASTKIHLEIERQLEGSLCHGRVQNTGKERKCSCVVSSRT
jgi:hypothetical protein